MPDGATTQTTTSSSRARDPLDDFWTGSAVPVARLGSLLAARDPRVIFVAGASGAGKSTLLARQFQLLARGRPAGFDYRFCHSRTLRGWDDLTIDPRPTRQNTALHLTLKRRVAPETDAVHARVHDVVLTDLVGAEVDRWAASAERVGELPVRAAHDLWVVLDLAAILQNRTARSRASELVDRVVEAAAGRPIALILAKADNIELPEVLSDPAAWGARASAVQTATEPLRRALGPVAWFAATSRGTLAPLAWSLAHQEAPVDERVPRGSGRYYDRFRELLPRSP